MGNNLCVERNPEEGQLDTKNEKMLASRSGHVHDNVQEEELQNDTQSQVQVQAEPQADAVTNDEQVGSMVGKIQNRWRGHQVEKVQKAEKEAKVNALRILDSNAAELGRYITMSEVDESTDSNVRAIDTRLGPYKGNDLDKSRLARNIFLRKPFKYNLDDSIYHGFWNPEGAREGYGYLIRSDGSKAEGLWKGNQLFKGRIISTDDTYYEGKVVNGEPNGEGTLYNKNGTATYIGKWENGKFSNFGMKLLGEGANYKGNFVNGEFSGEGSLTWADRSTYEGHFEENAICGQGTYRASDGSNFVGNFVNNQPNGNGRCTWKHSGSTYIGGYKHGKKEGKGVYTSKGFKYDGNWSGGKPNGQGTYETADFSVTGVYRHGHLIQTTSHTGATVPESVTIVAEREPIFEGSEMLYVKHAYSSRSTSPTKHYRPMNDQHELFDLVKKSTTATMA